MWRPKHMKGKLRDRSVTAASLGMPRTANKAPEARMKQSLALGFQRECGPPNSLGSDSRPPELWASSCWFNPASLWHFVMVALGKSYANHHPGNTTNCFTSTKAKNPEHIMNGFVYSYLQGCLKKNSYPQKWPWLEKVLALQGSHISNPEANFHKSSCIHSYHLHSVLQLNFQQMDLAVTMTCFLMLFHSLFFLTRYLGWLTFLVEWLRAHGHCSHSILVWLGVCCFHTWMTT